MKDAADAKKEEQKRLSLRSSMTKERVEEKTTNQGRFIRNDKSLNMNFCLDEPIYTIPNNIKDNDLGKFRNWTSNLQTRMRKTSNESQYSTSTTTSSVSNFAGSGFDCVKEEVINNLEKKKLS